MVAETLTSTRAAASFPTFKYHASGVLCCAYGTYEIAANVEDGDIFEMCKIPAGATVVDGVLMQKTLTPMRLKRLIWMLVGPRTVLRLPTRTGLVISVC